MLCVGQACVGRERLRAVRSVLSSLSSRSSVRSAEEDEMSDAWSWSLSVIDMDSLMEVRDRERGPEHRREVNLRKASEPALDG